MSQSNNKPDQPKKFTEKRIYNLEVVFYEDINNFIIEGEDCKDAVHLGAIKSVSKSQDTKPTPAEIEKVKNCKHKNKIRRKAGNMTEEEPYCLDCETFYAHFGEDRTSCEICKPQTKDKAECQHENTHGSRVGDTWYHSCLDCGDSWTKIVNDSVSKPANKPIAKIEPFNFKFDKFAVKEMQFQDGVMNDLLGKINELVGRFNERLE